MVGMNFSHDIRRAFQEASENGRHLIAAWGPRRDNTAEPLYDYLELIPPSADGEPWTVLTLVKQNDGLTVAFNLAGRQGGYATLDEALDEFEGLADTQSDRLNEPAQFSTSADWDNVQADPDDDQDDYGPEEMNDEGGDHDNFDYGQNIGHNRYYTHPPIAQEDVNERLNLAIETAREGNYQTAIEMADAFQDAGYGLYAAQIRGQIDERNENERDKDDDTDDYAPEDMGNAPEPIPGFHLDDVPPKVSATGDVDNLQAEVDRYKADIEAERNAERMDRERDRAQEYGGIPCRTTLSSKGRTWAKGYEVLVSVTIAFGAASVSGSSGIRIQDLSAIGAMLVDSASAISPVASLARLAPPMITHVHEARSAVASRAE